VFTYRPDGTFALRAMSRSVIARDTMEIAPTGEGLARHRHRGLPVQGPRQVRRPLLTPASKKLGDEAEDGLRKGLSRL
jgi:hypothetical protein